MKFELTIGITSFNRFFYLRNLLQSFSNIDRRRVQIIVVDNCSTETGIKEFLENEKNTGKIHDLFLRGDNQKRNWTNDEYIAKNIIINNAACDIILFLQDDLQFIVDEKTLLSVTESFRKTKALCCESNAIRKSTIVSNYNNSILAFETKFWIPKNNHFQTMGFFRSDVFLKFGLYPTEWPQTQEFWGRSEDWYDNHLKTYLPDVKMNISCWVPLFAPVWNDPRGGYAFIRGDKRYGHYLPPLEENYYKKLSFEEYKNLEQSTYVPVDFSAISHPVGWNYSIDSNGDQIKYPQSKIMLEGPISDF